MSFSMIWYYGLCGVNMMILFELASCDECPFFMMCVTEMIYHCDKYNWVLVRNVHECETIVSSASVVYKINKCHSY